MMKKFSNFFKGVLLNTNTSNGNNKGKDNKPYSSYLENYVGSRKYSDTGNDIKLQKKRNRD